VGADIYRKFILLKYIHVCEEWSRIPLAASYPGWGDHAACEAACERHAKCRFFTYFHDGGCRIYSDCEAPFQDPYGVGSDIYRQGRQGECYDEGWQSDSYGFYDLGKNNHPDVAECSCKNHADDRLLRCADEAENPYHIFNEFWSGPLFSAAKAAIISYFTFNNNCPLYGTGMPYFPS